MDFLFRHSCLTYTDFVLLTSYRLNHTIHFKILLQNLAFLFKEHCVLSLYITQSICLRAHATTELL